MGGLDHCKEHVGPFFLQEFAAQSLQRNFHTLSHWKGSVWVGMINYSPSRTDGACGCKAHEKGADFSDTTTVEEFRSLICAEDPTFVHPDQQNQGEREWLMKHNGGNAKEPMTRVCLKILGDLNGLEI